MKKICIIAGKTPIGKNRWEFFMQKASVKTM